MDRIACLAAACALLAVASGTAAGQSTPSRAPPAAREARRPRLRVRPMLSQAANNGAGDAVDLSKMRYWIEDLKRVPASRLPITDKFVSFEPWSGGFNNIRMSLELSLSLALATNRTLVLPDSYEMYKLPGVNAWADFFDLEDMARGIPIIHQKEFMQMFGLPNTSGRTTFPNARKGWSQAKYIDRGWQGIWELSKAYGFGEDENPNGQQAAMIYCVPTCPADGSEHYDALRTFTMKRNGRNQHMVATSTSSWDSDRIVHFSQNGLGHWYTSVFIRPLQLDIQHKRTMKTHCHFNDRIFDLAEAVLRELLARVPSFSCIHIRRGDFQFKQVLTPIEDIMANTKELFLKGEHLWVMTEEKRPHEFFAVMKDRYKVHFLTDYTHLLKDVNRALLPMIESVICSRGRVFSGTYLSTLSGYILRLRGYQEDIADKTAYFNQLAYPKDYQPEWDSRFPTFKNSRPPKGVFNPGWGREFREVWDFDFLATHGY